MIESMLSLFAAVVFGGFTLAFPPIIGALLMLAAKRLFSPRQKVELKPAKRLFLPYRKAELKAKIKYVIEAVASKQVDSTELTYQSIRETLMITRIAFPELKTWFVSRTYRLPYIYLYPMENLLSAVKASEEANPYYPPNGFAKELFSLLSKTIMIYESKPESESAQPIAYNQWKEKVFKLRHRLDTFSERTKSNAVRTIREDAKFQEEDWDEAAKNHALKEKKITEVRMNTLGRQIREIEVKFNASKFRDKNDWYEDDYDSTY